MSGWDESKHPRDEIGRFTDKEVSTATHAAKQAAGVSPQGWMVGTGEMDVAEAFVEARSKVPAHLQEYLSQYTPEELVAAGGRIFVDLDGLNGFIIAPDGDIQNLFSANGKGKVSMRLAIANGGTKLDCFDGFLPGYYQQFGFEEYQREANWTPGGPDVVFMRKRK